MRVPTAILHPVMGVLLALTLVVGSVGMAVARGQARPVQTLVICTGHDLATITLNADGEPVGPRHLCPDCVPAGLAVLTVAPVPTRHMTLTYAEFGAPLPLSAFLPRPPALARGPPLLS